jgi:hypothetical protein
MKLTPLPDSMRLMFGALYLTLLSSCSTTPIDDGKTKVAGYTIMTSRSPEGGGILTITKGGVLIHHQRNVAGAFYIGPNSPETDTKNLLLLSPGTDINGNQIPDLIVTEWTGGAHCCYTAHVFELGASLRTIGEIRGRDGGVLFRDLDGNGVYEAVIQDEEGRELVFTYTGWDYRPTPNPK